MQWKAGVYRNGDYLKEGCKEMTDIATHLDENLLVKGREEGGREGGREGGWEGGREGGREGRRRLV